jgi:hypothetical protein
VLPAGARLVVQYLFRSDEDGPLEVISSFPLQRDAPSAHFRIMGDGFEADSELRKSEEAVRGYERASLTTPFLPWRVNTATVW